MPRHWARQISVRHRAPPQPVFHKAGGQSRRQAMTYGQVGDYAVRPGRIAD